MLFLPKLLTTLWIFVLVIWIYLDYIGNVVIQKVVEKCTDPQRQQLIEQVAQHLAAFGIHKNGTWAVQKIIECAKTPGQMDVIVNALRPYTPPLLLDQFGNYVVQGCLRLGNQKNQFVFDALSVKCWELGQNRFGARAMRGCLESQFTTKRQQKDVSIAILPYAVQLSMSANGNILITWLMELSSLPGRYRSLAAKLAPHVAALCCHKLASNSILKLVNQRLEMDGREQIIREIFYKDSVLTHILSDFALGVSLIHKILSTGCVSQEERSRLADRVRAVMKKNNMDENSTGYKRLGDELSTIPTSTNINAADDIVSPLVPTSGFFSAPVTPQTQLTSPGRALASANDADFGVKGFFNYQSEHLPTPNQSPSYNAFLHKRTTSGEATFSNIFNSPADGRKK